MGLIRGSFHFALLLSRQAHIIRLALLWHPQTQTLPVTVLIHYITIAPCHKLSLILKTIISITQAQVLTRAYGHREPELLHRLNSSQLMEHMRFKVGRGSSLLPEGEKTTRTIGTTSPRYCSGSTRASGFGVDVACIGRSFESSTSHWHMIQALFSPDGDGQIILIRVPRPVPRPIL